MKKVISLMLSLVMLMSITAGLNLTAYADTLSGSCGEDANYSFDTETGVLTIDGTGDMNDYRSIPSPWYMYATTIYSIIIEDDITNIGIGAFADCG